MVRCPRCGLRLLDRDPVCGQHGRVERTASRVADPLPASAGRVEVPGYTLGELLGQGGFGVVYASRRQSDGQPVALKLSIAECPNERLLSHEAEILGAVGPPHVPAVFDLGMAQGRPYLALELIQAPTLADVLLETAGPIPSERFRSLAFSMLAPLEAIHRAGYVHLDLKPENLFVSGPDRVRILDFGLARRRVQKPLGAAVHPPEEAVGTAEYMSPEQCAGLDGLDVPSDLYSLGVLWYELLCGVPPFWGKAFEVREAHMSQRPQSLALRVPCGVRLGQLVGRCLAKSPAERWQSVAELRDELEATLGARGPSSRPSHAPGPPGAAANPALTKPQRVKLTMGLVFVEVTAERGRVEAAIARAGGQVVQHKGAHYAIAFDHDVSANPARLALLAARTFLSMGLATRCLIDVAPVSVQVRADGVKHLYGPAFSREVPSTQVGSIFMTRSAARAIPDLGATDVPNLPDLVSVPLGEPTQEHSSLGRRTGPLLGREDMLSCLLRSAERALSAAEPTVVSVTAEPGMGLTHLGSEVVSRLLLTSGQVRAVGLTVQDNPLGTPPALLPYLLRQVWPLPSAVPADGGRELLLSYCGVSEDGPKWAAVAYALGWVDTTHPELAPLLSATSALRFAVARAVGEVLRKSALERPLAVVIDNANLADEAALGALEYAAMKEASVPIWVCVLVRPGFLAGRPAWGDRAAGVERHELGPLAHADAVELVRELLWPVEHVPAKVLARLAERAHCVPRLLVELIAGLKREGFVRRYDNGAGYYLATDEIERLPEVPVLQWAVSRELETLAPELSWHARLCAVLGGHVGPAEVEELLLILERSGLAHADQLDALVGLRQLVDRRLLVAQKDGRYDFRHALLRDALYKLIPESLRTALHDKAYELYQGFEPLPIEQRLSKTALHAARSGRREAALNAYLALAERAQNGQSHLEAEAAFSRALENLPDADDPRQIRAAGGRGRVRFVLGRHEDSLNDLRAAQARAHAVGQREVAAGLMLDEAMVLDWMADYASSEAVFQQVRALVPNAEGLLGLRVAVAQTRSHHRKFEREACLETGARTAELARTFGEAGHESRMVAQLVMLRDYIGLGRLDEAERCGDSIIAEAQARNDLLHLNAAFNNRHFLWAIRCDAPRCLADLDAAARIAREVGSPALEFYPANNAADMALFVGNTELARRHAKRAAELATLLGTEFWVFCQELAMARSWLYEGALHEVHALLPGLRARLARPRMFEEINGYPSLRAQLAMVELGACNAPDADWQALEDSFGAAELQAPERIELVEARALSAYRNGAVAVSRAHFERAVSFADASPCLIGERVKQSCHALRAQLLAG